MCESKMRTPTKGSKRWKCKRRGGSASAGESGRQEPWGGEGERERKADEGGPRVGARPKEGRKEGRKGCRGEERRGEGWSPVGPLSLSLEQEKV
ncbi:hypothetical protein M758_9G189400 [Ceratodon purpureus]|nr:hypothetical protein M758_9G189400 [Ceratodon purpureus]